jgi:hypothetical protein
MNILMGILLYLALVLLTMFVNTNYSKKCDTRFKKMPIVFFMASIFMTPYCLIAYIYWVICKIIVFFKKLGRN